MSLESHLAQLVRKHSDLEREIVEANAHKSVDTLNLAQLKRKKLKLKEEIERMRNQTRH